MGDFCMPSLGADMDVGKLVEWRIKPGDTVKRGDVVALVETHKGLVEVEIWESGTIEALLVEAGAEVPVGAVLARVRGDGAPDLARPSARAAGAHVQASPAARQLARERGIELSALQGTGPHGAVTRDDVARAAAAAAATSTPTPTATAPTTAPSTSTASASAPGGMRRAIAAAMARSKREIPHYYLAQDLDVSRAQAWLERTNATRPPAERILFAALLLRATALAAREVPEVNGHFVDGRHRPSDAVHLGVAISLRSGGLVAPALHDVDKMPVAEVMAALRDLVARARGGTLRASEMTDATITVTNLGDQGVVAVYGVIYPPQVALVGFGKVSERAWAEGGMLGVRPVVTVTLAADHRASDGHRGALFLAAIGRHLAEPEAP
jgi:pyruvate dehydrogenase E2 component (dihydrolipoamide acetyltransferase)